jgi:hypothetical protein
MRRFALAAVAAGLFFTAARAQADTYAFTAVDGVRFASATGSLYVTGVLDGAAAATDEKLVKASTSLDLLDCQRLAILSMSRPGYYRFELSATRVTPTSGNPYLYVYDCALRRANP